MLRSAGVHEPHRRLLVVDPAHARRLGQPVEVRGRQGPGAGHQLVVATQRTAAPLLARLQLGHHLRHPAALLGRAERRRDEHDGAAALPVGGDRAAAAGAAADLDERLGSPGAARRRPRGTRRRAMGTARPAPGGTGGTPEDRGVRRRRGSVRARGHRKALRRRRARPEAPSRVQVARTVDTRPPRPGDPAPPDRCVPQPARALRAGRTRCAAGPGASVPGSVPASAHRDTPRGPHALHSFVHRLWEPGRSPGRPIGPYRNARHG